MNCQKASALPCLQKNMDSYFVFSQKRVRETRYDTIDLARTIPLLLPCSFNIYFFKSWAWSAL